MYLARVYDQQETRYILRESFQADNVLRSRDLFDLGDDPGRFITYPGGTCFHVSEELEDGLSSLGVSFDDEELEDLLLPFVDPEIRFKMEPFMHRGTGRTCGPLSRAQKEAVWEQGHIFDKRRLYFLRYGNIDQGNIFGLPAKLFRPLLGKSRDELEQFFLAEEGVLEAGSVKEYLYVAFDLQRFFTEMIARSMPQGLDPEKMDALFLDEVCQLNDDRGFWAGFERAAGLPVYLARYVWLYFDAEFAQGSAWNEYVRQFMGNRRQFSWPDRQPSVSDERLTELFGHDAAVLKKMNKRELTKLFRQKAHEHHPDKGGVHDYFVELAAVYNELLKGKVGDFR